MKHDLVPSDCFINSDLDLSSLIWGQCCVCQNSVDQKPLQKGNPLASRFTMQHFSLTNRPFSVRVYYYYLVHFSL